MKKLTLTAGVIIGILAIYAPEGGEEFVNKQGEKDPIFQQLRDALGDHTGTTQIDLEFTKEDFKSLGSAIMAMSHAMLRLANKMQDETIEDVLKTILENHGSINN